VLISRVLIVAKSAYYFRHVRPFLCRLPSNIGCSHLILGTFMKIWHESPNLVKIGQKYCALYMNTWVGFIVVDDIKSSQKRSFRPKLPYVRPSVRPSVRSSVRPFFHIFVSPHVSSWIPRDRFTWNFILRNFMKISWGFLPHLVEIGQNYRTPYSTW